MPETGGIEEGSSGGGIRAHQHSAKGRERVKGLACAGRPSTKVLALLAQKYLLYWYKSTNTDASFCAPAARRQGSAKKVLLTCFASC